MDVKNVRFPEFSEGEKGSQIDSKSMGNIPVRATVELGETQLNLKDIMELAEGSIIELDRLAGEPLDLKVGGQLVAQGEVVAINDSYGLRITNVVMK